VQHLPPPKAAAHLAADAQARAHGERLLLRRVEAEKTQHAAARAVLHRDEQLAARAQLHFAGRDRGLDLHHLPVARLRERRDARFVLVAQRQVQRQVDVAHQAELAQGFLRAARRGFARILGRLVWRGARRFLHGGGAHISGGVRGSGHGEKQENAAQSLSCPLRPTRVPTRVTASYNCAPHGCMFLHQRPNAAFAQNLPPCSNASPFKA
jgi:hypothetical protein